MSVIFCAPCRALAVIATANWAGDTNANLPFAMHHVLNRPCVVISRIRPRASSHARLRLTVARLAPVRASARFAATLAVYGRAVLAEETAR